MTDESKMTKEGGSSNQIQQVTRIAKSSAVQMEANKKTSQIWSPNGNTAAYSTLAADLDPSV